MSNMVRVSAVRFAALALLASAFLPVDAVAGLVTVDAWTTGDARLTRDTATNLDWLDVTVTDGKSVNDITVDNFGNLSGLGFRLPTLQEVSILFTDAGAIGDPFIDSRNSANIPVAQNLISLLGCVSCLHGFSSADISFMNGYVLSDT